MVNIVGKPGERNDKIIETLSGKGFDIIVSTWKKIKKDPECCIILTPPETDLMYRKINSIINRNIPVILLSPDFDKEKVTDDLANKTTIKDGVVHVPFSVDDFPKEDWDLYFEDFEVSNKKFGFTDYIVKEYGAGEVDSEEIWKEYQEAILHRLMNGG